MEIDRGYEKAAPFYDLFDNKNNIEFFYHYAKEKGIILDIGAGTGRIAKPLAERGVKVICIEPSPAMRREFIKKIKNNPNIEQMITLIAADAQSFDLKEKFQLAILSGSFDHFMSDTERISSLMNINRHLKPGGYLVFDVFIGLMKSSPLKLVNVIKKDENVEYHRLIETKVFPNRKIELQLDYRIYENGKLMETIEQKSITSIITREEVHQLLKYTGFRIIKEYSNYNFQQFQEGDSILIIEAEKIK